MAKSKPFHHLKDISVDDLKKDVKYLALYIYIYIYIYIERERERESF